MSERHALVTPRFLPLAIGGALLVGAFLGPAADGAEPAPSRPAADAASDPARTAPVEFAREVAPILAARCGACHGPEKREAGLRLDDGAALRRGGDSGPAIVPHQADDSLLVERISADDPIDRMPPEGPPLSVAEIRLIRAWIEAGGAIPDAVQSAAASQNAHWSFQPVRRPEPPAVKATGRSRNDIDLFVLARLEREGIPPSPEADRATLLRRLSLDLTGLPPTPDEVEAFFADDRPDAYERLAERLLASPHFGERWGMHWLDLARYADSDGFEKDHFRPHAWRWRDWVIDAVNRDVPFDRFTVEQIAGDLLPDATLDQRIATGFHRNAPKNREGGIDEEEARVKAVVDRVGTTGTVWLGLTVACAECHSHKYDPLSQREFYELFAFFNDRVDDADIPLPDESGKLAEDPKKGPQAPALARRDRPRTTRIFIRGNFLEKGDTVSPGTPAVLPPPSQSGWPGLDRREAADATSGDRPLDRLDLGRWIVDPAHPLTARVEVNRIWQHLFGDGLVRTPEDFGAQGDPPTHPELLDWLATEFVKHGWSRKELIRRIVHSATYRQSSNHRPELLERDPQNLLLARQNRYRLDAELVRDQYLAASGLLNRQVGGPGFRPPLPPGLERIGFQLTWEPDKGQALYRRSMYIVLMRNVLHPLLTTFDRPDPSVACTRRERSNTPLQALAQLNEPLFVESSRALGRSLAADSSLDDAARLERAFVQSLARRPTGEERAVLEKL
ncbi:MAG: PSD1 and planctomycete cytochrome C domain-containing protein, partial [Planctomycetaceae bacterium]